jgi:hypothetical protein
MDLEQRLRTGDGSGTGRERERKERRWSGKSKKGVEMVTDWEMRDEREKGMEM